jgi:hypothetical protein
MAPSRGVGGVQGFASGRGVLVLQERGVDATVMLVLGLGVVVVLKVVVADGPRGVCEVVVLGGALMALWWPGLDGAAALVPCCCAQ